MSRGGRSETNVEAKSQPADRPAIQEWLLDLLVCPIDRGPLQRDGAVLRCETCDRSYPIVDGIPDLLADEE